jgi:prepilin-type processing-associated H-X9-DG protein
LPIFHCPGTNQKNEMNIINYIAIVGPGTIWRKDGTVKLSDLPDDGWHSVALVEVADSDKHWAEPFTMTVDEILENMKTSKGLRISSYHSGGVNVLFADGVVRYLPPKMPLSLWSKIFAGERIEFDNIEAQIDPNAPDMVDVYVGAPSPKPWTIILGAIVWLISIGLLFHRAVKSRKKPEIEPNPLAS